MFNINKAKMNHDEETNQTDMLELSTQDQTSIDSSDPDSMGFDGREGVDDDDQ